MTKFLIAPTYFLRALLLWNTIDNGHVHEHFMHEKPSAIFFTNWFLIKNYVYGMESDFILLLLLLPATITNEADLLRFSGTYNFKPLNHFSRQNSQISGVLQFIKSENIICFNQMLFLHSINHKMMNHWNAVSDSFVHIIWN